MGRQFDVKVDDLYGIAKGFTLVWSGSIGFGTYTVYMDEDGKIKGDSECMDKGDDKSFLEHLLKDLVQQLEVE